MEEVASRRFGISYQAFEHIQFDKILPKLEMECTQQCLQK